VKRLAVLDLLLALRKHGIAVTSVSCGGVTLDGVVDTKLNDATPPKPETRKSMWEERAEALARNAAEPSAEVPEEAVLE
jgi:hypothetical protein